MLRDTLDNPFNSLNLDARAGQERVFIVRLDAEAGKSLKASASAVFAVSAREAGSNDSFTDLEGAGLDLTPYAPGEADFEIKLTATGAAGQEQQIKIFVS